MTHNLSRTTNRFVKNCVDYNCVKDTMMSILTFTLVSLMFETPQKVLTMVTPSWSLETGKLFGQKI